MFRTLFAAAMLALASFAFVPAAHAQVNLADDQFAASADAAQNQAAASERLMIVNRNTGRVIYDDRRNDLFCATGRYVVGYTDWGRPIYRRTMRCR